MGGIRRRKVSRLAGLLAAAGLVTACDFEAEFRVSIDTDLPALTEKIVETPMRRDDRLYRVIPVLNQASNNLDSTLIRKDLEGFVAQYEINRQILDEMGKISPEVGGLEYGRIFRLVREELTQDVYGNIHTRIAARPEIVFQDPSQCGPEDPLIRAMTDDLMSIASSRRLDEAGLDYSGQTGWWTTVYSDEARALMVGGNVSSVEQSNDGQRFSPEGTYTRFMFSGPDRARTASFAEFTTSKDGITSIVIREVDVIDMGMDGIDRCDAPLNDLDPDQPDQIDEANQQYRGALERTLSVLRERYPGELDR